MRSEYLNHTEDNIHIYKKASISALAKINSVGINELLVKTIS